MKSTGGYVALHRSVFDNEKLDGKFSRREAFIWLIARAAWEKTVHKLARGSLTVQRGQLAASTRRLAQEWQWSEAGVRRYLNFLRREKMIAVDVARADALPDALKLVKGMVITVCNYEKFQDGKKSFPQKATHYPTRSMQQSFLFPITCAAEEPKKEDIKIGNFEGGKRESGPRHGARSRNGTVFIKSGTAEWESHAADYLAIVGAAPEPDRNGGFWFWPVGEAHRPTNLWHLRQRIGRRA